MRSRFLAIFILIILVVVPLSLYWYFTTKNIAKLNISTSGGADFSVTLVGTFGIDGLPLADTMLSYQQNCTNTCMISPILPARYILTLTASGKTTLTDTVIVNSGDDLSKSYILNDDIVLVPIGNITKDESNTISLIDHAISQGWGEFESIGTDIKNRVWVIKKGETFSQIGWLTQERFISIRSITSQILGASLDSSLSILIFELTGNRTLLMSTDLSQEKEIITIPNIVSVIPGDTWKIQTSTGSIEIKGDQYIDDIRFTSSIDISPQIRIGYIDKKDTKKLSIANLSTTESVLIRLDRNTGTSVILRKGIDIRALFFYNNQPAYIDNSGNIYIIEVN